MTQAYLLFSVGPVQSAISQARRTQDLFMGSRVLSLLVRAGLDAVQAPAKVIYPSVKTDDRSIPNRFLVHCETAQVESLAGAIYDAIDEAWLRIAGETRVTFESPPPRGVGIAINPVIWNRQVSNWLEIYHVSVLDTGNYGADNLNANRLLAARKLIRNFRECDEPGHKCSITGEHEALHGEASGQASLAMVRTYWDAVRLKQRNLAILSKGERLCALSLIKRFAHEAIPSLNPDGRFPSTSSIASVPFRAAIIEDWDRLQFFVGCYLTELENLFQHHFRLDRETPYFHRGIHHDETLHPERFLYLEAIRSPGDDRTLLKFRSLDGDFLYEEGIQPSVLQAYTGAGTPPSLQQLEALQSALKNLYAEARKSGIQTPSSYLAVLSMDGDRMGEQAQKFRSASEHGKFSERLANFARTDVPRIVENDAPGRLIYAGGDDVLALVPAEFALIVAENLRVEFAQKFQQEGLHVSTGIAFVHRTHPLQWAVLAAKNAQEQAKKAYGRNALAAALLQRSGEPLYMGMKWEVIDPDDEYEMYSTVEILRHIVKAMSAQEQKLSRSLPYDIEHIIYAFAESDMPPEPRRKEFERIYRRRYQSNDDYKADGLYGAGLCRAILALAEPGLIDAVNWLRLARFLSGEGVQNVAVS